MAIFSTVTVGFAIKVRAVTEVKLAPKRHPIVNRFDEHGDFFSLDRFPLETNTDFKKRIMDMTFHPGGPHYEGLLNNLSRELGSPRQLAITIDLKQDSDGSPLARNPRVDILANRVVLYGDWRDHNNSEIDKEINIYDLGSAGYYLNGLVQEINTSQYFTAVLSSEIRPNLHSANLVRGNTYGKVTDDIIRNDQLTVLRMRNIVEGSVWFSDKKTFKTEVLVEPQQPGEYMINYRQGWVVSYTASDGQSSCGYYYSTFPYKVDASLVHIYSLQDPNYTEKLFNREVLQSGEDIDALPNTEGAEVFHQLFKETKVFWGE
jgi:hypothetical protein